ncbi:MAG: hypothetical protein M1824_003445 [Vezdaea acicularis]|nr:MAG: hypothetical protein M1824_003445 [Vezdaea acicularis]
MPRLLYAPHGGPRHGFGLKKVYLPNFTVTLLRTPDKPPTYAQFIVPLNFNKFDMKDYLYHGYGVRVLSVRSYVKQMPVQQDKPGKKIPAQNRWYRPRSIKKMTVEMMEPFVWPKALEDEEREEKFDEKQKAAMEKARKAEEKLASPDGDMQKPGDYEPILEQAKELLEEKQRRKEKRDRVVVDTPAQEITQPSRM